MATRMLILLFLLLLQSLAAQTILVTDAENGAPVERVLIYDPLRQASILTNEKGNANLGEFPSESLLHFQHPSYETLLILKEKLPANGQVILQRRTIQLSEFVVSANKWEQNRAEIPGRISSLGPAEIRLHNPSTMADALESSGEIFVQRSQLGGGSPMIRGFSANAVLIVVDGVRMNNAIFRSGNLQNVILIDPYSIDNAEVVFGPGSVIYGSDALGGVMDFHTRKPIFAYEEGMLLRTEAQSRYASANQSQSHHLHFILGWKNIASLTSLSYYASKDLRAGSQYPAAYPDFGKKMFYVERIDGRDSVLRNKSPEKQIPSGYHQWNLQQKLRFRLSNTWDLQYALTASGSSDIPRYDRLTEVRDSLPVNAEWFYGPQLWTLQQITLNHKAATSFYDESKIIVAMQKMEESRNDRKFRNDWLRAQTESLHTYHFLWDAHKKWSESVTLFYGMEYDHNDISSKASRRNLVSREAAPSASRYPDGENKYNTYALYAQGKFRLPSLPAFFHAGVRYSIVSLASTLSDDRFYPFPFDEIQFTHSALNGSLGFVYPFLSRWRWRVNLSSGFRAPNLDDVGKIFDSEPGNVIVPNPDLNPEYAYNLETGIHFQQGGLQVEAEVFYTFVEDVMVRRDFQFNGMDSLEYEGVMSNVQALVNGDRARIWGGSLSTYYNVNPQWFISQSVTYIDGYELEGRTPLRHTPPVYGRIGFGWTGAQGKAECYTVFNGWKRWEDLAPSEQSKSHLYTPDGSPSWFTLNIKTQWKLAEELEATFGIENIFDRHYRPYSSGISAPGRNFLLGLRLKP